MMKSTPPVCFAVVLVAVVAAGPSWAEAPGGQARLRTFDPALLETGELILYRDLDRSDFRAHKPPAEAVGPHAPLGAVTCVFLATEPDAYIYSSSRGLDLQFGQFRARIENLGFIAYMDRECSWWNPAPLTLPADYVLQHEQIHFALFEVAARRLDRRAAELTRELETVSTNQQQGVDAIHERLDAELLRAVNEVVARNKAFDRDTSMIYRQDRQSWWWTTVAGELERYRSPGRHP